MNGYYETSRERDTRLRVFRNHQNDFPPHFHNNVEIYLLEEGEQQVVCNGETHLLRAGTVAFFDSYAIHGYLPPKSPQTNGCVLIIPFALLGNFRTFRQKGRVLTPVIHDCELTKTLLQIVDGIFLKTEDKNLIAAAVDMVFALLEGKLRYGVDEEKEDVSLVKKILEFIETNFRTDTRLCTIAANLGYTEEHLSREFHKLLRQSIPSYVNRLRLDYVEYERKKGEKTLTELVYEAGFHNLQTYYRNKKAHPLYP